MMVVCKVHDYRAARGFDVDFDVGNILDKPFVVPLACDMLHNPISIMKASILGSYFLQDSAVAPPPRSRGGPLRSL